MPQKNKPRVCFGMTLYNNAKYLPEAIESLLNQTYSDFHLVAVDDCSTDETEEIIRRYAERDKRISYFRNSEWSGMIATWRRAFYEAYDLHRPDYFAWASDHDRWHPEWLSQHIKVLDEHSDVVLAYPQTVPISPDGMVLEDVEPMPFETHGMRKVDRLFHACTMQTAAGEAAYGLFRVDALLKSGVFRRVIMPDRLLITEINAYGAIKQIKDKLWFRRHFISSESHEELIEKQRKNLFGPQPPPLHAYCPFVSHIASLVLYLSILPPSRNYSTFWTGLIMAGLLWETYKKKFIKNEISTLQKILSSELRPDQISIRMGNEFGNIPSEHLITVREIGAVIESMLGRIAVEHETFSYIQSAFIVGIMMNHDKNLTDLHEELEAAQSKVGKLRGEVEEFKAKYETSSEEVKYWKREASLSIREIILKRTKNLIKKIV